MVMLGWWHLTAAAPRALPHQLLTCYEILSIGFPLEQLASTALPAAGNQFGGTGD